MIFRQRVPKSPLVLESWGHLRGFPFTRCRKSQKKMPWLWLKQIQWGQIKMRSNKSMQSFVVSIYLPPRHLVLVPDREQRPKIDCLAFTARKETCIKLRESPHQTSLRLRRARKVASQKAKDHAPETAVVLDRKVPVLTKLPRRCT